VDDHDAALNDVLLTIGDRVVKARKQKRLRLLDLARRIKMDPPNLDKVECGKKNVTIDTLVRIAEGLGMALDVRFVKRRST
jgi:transcriptional regulator with XRE-family HTH domain